MTSRLRRPNTTQYRKLSMNTMNATGNTHENYVNSQSYYTQGLSLAEANIARYNDVNGNRKTINNDIKLDTRTNPDTGLQHPYNKVCYFFILFSLDF